MARHYESLLGLLGPELQLLNTVPLEDIGPATSSLVTEAVSRLRRQEVIRHAGYDGVYGTIRLFQDAELRQRTLGASLFREEGREARGAEARMEPPMPPSPGETAAPTASPPRDRSRTRTTSHHRAPDLVAGLDADQRLAVETVTGPLLIVAGPGSGKTRTLTHRIAHLVERHGVPPARCLAITFTRRAAGELRDRLRALLPEAWAQLALHTFHSLGLSILTEHHNAAGLQRGFRVASEAERVQLLRDALDISEKRARSRLSAISRAKRTGAAPSDEASIAAFAAYERAMEIRNLCDFDDLVIRAADALESSPALQAQYRRRYRWISVDEYQDVDEQQVRLLKQLVAPDGNVCAIGDPDQAIYGFRGADVRFFSEFRRDFPGTRVVRLTRNYRSDRNIVALATQVIDGAGPGRHRDSVGAPVSSTEPAPVSEAVPVAEPASTAESVLVVESASSVESASGMNPVPVAEPARAPEPAPSIEDLPDLVTLHEAPTEKAEAEFVVRSLERALGGHSFFSIDSGRSADPEGPDLSFSDFAVLYRTEAQVPALVEALQRSGMPFQHRSHRRLLDHPGVVAALDGLREAPAEGSVRERLEAVCLGGDGRRDAHRREAWELLRPVAVACGDDPRRFISVVSLGAEIDTWDPRADRISLLTLHAAKGLEFPVVFIVGCERGLLPLTWGRASRSALDEERRLFYVGVTRAKTKLYLCRAGRRLWRGKIRELPPSPYLADIEERLLERRRSRIPGRHPKADDGQLSLFS